MGSVSSWTYGGVLFAVGCLLAAYTANEGVAATQLAPLPERSVARPSPPVRQEDIEKTLLPVTLLGTFAASDPSLSRATLRDRESQETLVVGVGDQIKDVALVTRIERERVVLRENGATRDLTIDGAEHGASQSTGPSPSAPSATTLTHLLGQAHVLPKFEDDQVVGLEVSAIQAGSLFDEIGLEDGDVITEWNGEPIDSQAKTAKILQETSEAGAYHVVGRRADGSDQVWDFVRRD